VNIKTGGRVKILLPGEGLRMRIVFALKKTDELVI
jgi:hypothetical protein